MREEVIEAEDYFDALRIFNEKHPKVTPKHCYLERINAVTRYRFCW